jgi:hypothetical protein
MRDFGHGWIPELPSIVDESLDMPKKVEEVEFLRAQWDHELVLESLVWSRFFTLVGED